MTADKLTNEELIPRLRELRGTYGIGDTAADRIEALVKERDKWRDCFNTNTAILGETEHRADAAEAALKEAVEAKLDAISTLDAWFDRRELGHAAVDQAVVDAASGYLRTSRSGGMPQEESDLVLGVMQDMARLGLFADLFARAFLTKHGSQK